MKVDNFYVSYKRDTRLLLYWIIKTSNAIIKKLKDSAHKVALEINITGQVTVSDLIPLSELIAKYHADIPSTIYYLFQSVIKLRSIYHSQFQQLAAATPSEELETNNSTHKFFIDTLTRAFEVLGGESWLSEERAKRASNDKEDGCDTNAFAFTNKFSLLDLESESENDDDLDADSEKSDKQSAPSLKKRKLRKGKKRVKAKKTQRDCKSSKSDGRAPDVTLESYRIIEDDDMTEYFMAVLALSRDMLQFRLFLQDVWRKVAYNNLNSAVAAAISNIAVAMVKQSEMTIFSDFPGYESYERIKQAVLRDETEQANNEIRCTILVEGLAQTMKALLDKKELFLIHTYHDLVDFITDYQKTRSGKPTKRMLAQIDNWNPNLDLQKATKEERIKWRRSYTINWLYDLVNITACVAIHGEHAKNEDYVLEEMDWSDQGPLRSHHRMFGLINFAAEVTTLAMQKHGTDFSHKISPHLVFHLQCIIDAWTVSRGWAISWMKGHVLSEPAQSFQPRRDLDIFLGCENWKEEKGDGFFQAIIFLDKCLVRLKHKGKSLEVIRECIGILDELRLEFLDALGKCEIFDSLSALLPSRLASSNPNGAWDYSPFLCGAGLAEGLELLYRSIMVLWEGMLEPTLIIHLHHMLVQKGYLKQSISLYVNLGMVFSVGKSPSREESQKMINRREVEKATRARDLLNLVPLPCFKQKSSLAMYGSAGWDPDRVPDSDVDPLSALGLIRLSQTRRIRDPVTSVWRLEETDLVQRARAAGMGESTISALDPLFELFRDERQAQMDRVRPDYSPWLYDANKASKKAESSVKSTKCEVTAERLLRIIYKDVQNDVCSRLRAFSNLSYIYITMQMVLTFEKFESECQTSSNPTLKLPPFDDAELGDEWGMPRSVHLALSALHGKDEELLKSMATIFERGGGRFIDYLYWKAEDEDKDKTSRGPVTEDCSPDCCVM
ncbi:hypothetical protein ACHAPX_004524 [Trichoderma viride]